MIIFTVYVIIVTSCNKDEIKNAFSINFFKLTVLIKRRKRSWFGDC